MNGHLSFRSGNPALRKNTFAERATDGSCMTLSGTVNKTAISLLILITGVFYERLPVAGQSTT